MDSQPVSRSALQLPDLWLQLILPQINFPNWQIKVHSMPKVTKSHWVLVNVKQHWAEGERERMKVEAGEGGNQISIIWPPKGAIKYYTIILNIYLQKTCKSQIMCAWDTAVHLHLLNVMWELGYSDYRESGGKAGLCLLRGWWSPPIPEVTAIRQQTFCESAKAHSLPSVSDPCLRGLRAGSF